MNTQHQESEVIFFQNSSSLRLWYEENAETASEVWIGYYKKKSGVESIDWSQSVDEALCFGWIDGIRKSIDEEKYKIRFTPRRPGSHWSKVNIEKVRQLTEAGRMTDAGLGAFGSRKKENTGKASFEQGEVSFGPDYLSMLNKHPDATAYYVAQPPYYRKTCAHWVMSAKREETRLKRMEILIDSCARGEKIPPFRWAGKK